MIVTDYQHWPGIHEQVIHHADKMEQFELAFKDAILEVLGPQDAGIWGSPGMNVVRVRPGLWS